MVSSRNLHALEDPAASDWQFVLETVDTFNKVRKLTEISLKSQKEILVIGFDFRFRLKSQKMYLKNQIDTRIGPHKFEIFFSNCPGKICSRHQ